jgi:DNA-directed RNA polymerase
MVPRDSFDEASSAQKEVYPSSSVIDSISMIGICLRRKEHIPRAYQIFRQLYEDYEVGLRPMPDADVFGRLTEGCYALAMSGSSQAERWRNRGELTVARWEKAMRRTDPIAKTQSVPRGDKVAVKDRRGLKVYGGWFSGLLA